MRKARLLPFQTRAWDSEGGRWSPKLMPGHDPSDPPVTAVGATEPYRALTTPSRANYCAARSVPKPNLAKGARSPRPFAPFSRPLGGLGMALFKPKTGKGREILLFGCERVGFCLNTNRPRSWSEGVSLVTWTSRVTATRMPAAATTPTEAQRCLRPSGRHPSPSLRVQHRPERHGVGGRCVDAGKPKKSL